MAARLVAFDLLRAVHEDDAYANLALPKLLAASTLDERDRALAAELGYGALRAEGTLDHVIALCIDRPLAEVDSAVLDVLRLGVYQLLRTRVGAHAAVNTSVDLTRTVVGEGASKFVNAVLRKVDRRGGDL
ncbi:MAG: transcription antitermination factor NusB, partial [Mycobacteriales bacterium]